MTKMRVGLHSGKRSQKTGKVIRPPHNDEDRAKNENVKAELVDDNFYFNCYDGEYTAKTQEGKLTFQESELLYYTEHYQNALNVQNEKHLKARQKKRVKTMENWLDSPRYAPTETILRVGNVDDGFVDRIALKKMTDDYIARLNKWSAEHNNCLHVLNYVLHADEYYTDEDTEEEKNSSTHVHIRYVWDYVDENGNLTIGCEKALEKAGYKLPHPDEKEGRHNNRIMSFTAEFRGVWQEIVKSYGFDVEIVPLPTKRRTKDKQTYVAEKRAQKEIAKGLQMQNDCKKGKKSLITSLSLLGSENCS